MQAFESRPTPVRGLASGAPYRVPRHPAPIDLWLDSNEGRAPDAARLEPAEILDPERLRRYPAAAELERELARREGLEPENCLVTCGADDALLRICLAMLEPGRRAIVPEPTFAMLTRYIGLTGAELESIPWDRGPYPTDRVIAALRSGNDRVLDSAPAGGRGPVGPIGLVALVSPNNPTGASAEVADLERVAAAAAEHCPGALVVADLAYAEFDHRDLTAAAAHCGNVVAVRTLSKAHGLAGLRLGYALGPPEVIGWLRAAGNPYPVSGPAIALGLQWLERGADSVEDRVQRVRSERGELAQTLRALAVESQPSAANFVLARCGSPSRAAWLRDALAGLGIAVRGFPGMPQLADAIRITCPGAERDQARLRVGLEAALGPEVLLFDLDGVLADVSRSYRAAIVATAASFGAEIIADDIAAMKARGDANDDWRLTQRLIVAARGRTGGGPSGGTGGGTDGGTGEGCVEPTLEAVTERFEALYQGGLREREQLVPPREWLVALAERMPLGLVTGRPRADAEHFLGRFGLRELFGALVCREDAALKPDPAPVRLALERLGARRAWMVGDSPDDVRAARAARVVPIGVSPAGTGEDASASLYAAGCARVLDRVEDLRELLS